MKQIWRTRLTIAAFPLAALGLSALIYTSLAERDARVSDGWKRLNGELTQQMKLAPRVAEVVSRIPVSPAEQNGAMRDVRARLATLQALEDRTQLYLGDPRLFDDQDRMSDLAGAAVELNRAIVSVTSAAKQIAAAPESAAYSGLAEEVAAADRRFARARAEFNQAVRDHNGSIDGFPMRLFARLADFNAHTYFRVPRVGQH